MPAFGIAAIGIIDGELSGLQIFAVVAIPAITLAHVVRIYRHLRAVRHERPVGASEELLAGVIWGNESMALLALIALIVGQMSN